MLNRHTRISHTAKFTRNRFMAVCILWFLYTTAQTMTLPTDPEQVKKNKDTLKVGNGRSLDDYNWDPPKNKQFRLKVPSQTNKENCRLNGRNNT